MQKLCRFTLSFLLLGTGPMAQAVSIEEFATRPEVADVKISPSGEHLALRVYQEGKHGLVFLDREDLSATGSVGFSGKAEVGPFFWANAERVVAKIYEVAKHDREPKYYGELYAANYDGSRAHLIFGVRSGQMSTGSLIRRGDSDRAWAEIIDRLPADNRQILISSTPMSRNHDERPRALTLDIYKGLESNPHKVAAFPDADFLADRQGEVRVVKSSREDKKLHVELLPEPDGDWLELGEEGFGSTFLPLAITAEGQSLYVLDNIDSDKAGLYRLSLDGSSYKNIYTHESVDISGFGRTTDGSEIYAMRVDDGYPRYLLFSDAFEEAKLFKKLLATFPGELVDITSRSDDGRFWVVRTSSDTNPGSYFLYDAEEVRVQLIFTAKPQLSAADLSPMEPVSFESFDGKIINGYFTRAQDSGESEATPLVVLVHGGPRSRDYWGYDPEVQMLAAQGYSVLQVNFRGSSGYGQAFMRAGNRQWGDAVQKDIIAGTQWAIDSGRADGERVCIMGASFGAYSAMQSAALEPGLYQCVVASAGIYDLAMMYTEGDIEYRYGGEAYLEEVIGRDEELLRRFSPASHADRIESAVLLAHGGKDERAPEEQFEAMQEALEEADKEFEVFFERSEGHGFYHDQHRAAYWRSVADFLEQEIGPD